MSSKSLCQAFLFGPVLSLSVALASCSGPVPVGTNSPGGSDNGSGSGSGSGSGAGGSGVILNPGATSISTSTDTEITDQENCGVTTHDTTRQPANLLLILDRSESMKKAMARDQNCTDGDCRWPTVKTVLSTVFDSSADSVSWGLKLYSTPGQGDCTVSSGADVPIAPGSTKSINDKINQTTPGGNTPTRKAVAMGVEYLQKLNAPGGKSILLATDGQPNCKGTSSNITNDVVAATAAVKAAFDAGFKVYVLGIGPDSFTDTLNGFADKGGTAVKDIGGPGKDYYAAVSAEELSKNLNSIVSAVASCNLSLGSKPPVPNNIAVQFDDNKSLRAPQSKTDGWAYTSDTSIQLYGSWCERLSNGTFKTVKVLFGCEGKIIP